MLNENTPVIETERLILRKADASDAEALFVLLSDKETNEFLPWFPLNSVVETDEFIRERFTSYYRLESAYRYLICTKGDNKAIGYIWIAADDSRDLGYAVRKDYRGRGIVSEAAKAVIDRARKAGYPFITAKHDAENPASGTVMRNIGMDYKYSYTECVAPKNVVVNFRMYQINFDGCNERVYMKYYDYSATHSE